MKRTELAIFREEFRQALEPCLRELAAFGESLAGHAADGLPVAQLEPLFDGLRASAQELARLLERVAHERAQVHVFGPPNAGKSTLVNALAGVHAVEVSSLPGYPCPLRVGHAREPAARLERFDGTTLGAPTPAALLIHLQRSHAELADSARSARARGAPFDPARDLPSAVRRVELELPAPALERAATELFECPPIHGGLFSSYTEMLMGGSGGPSVAVFVLRVSQLFDAQAFSAFEELLESFERLFLVINLDGASRDLSTEGQVVTALERTDPLRVVEVFEKLTTCETLERGLAEGRVRIAPIDLLEAAHARFALESDGSVRGGGGRTRFDDFLDELAETLDGHPAFLTLVASALRRAHELVEETRSIFSLSVLAELPARLDQAELERAAKARKGHALRRLRARERSGWENEKAFIDLRARLIGRASARVPGLLEELAGPLSLTIEDWFASPESVQGLIRGRLAPRAADALGEIQRCVERALREELAAGGVLQTLSPDVERDLAEAGLALAELVAAPSEGAGLPGEVTALLPLDVEAIAVKARFRDRLLLRSAARTRRGLFGPPEAPARSLSTEHKEKRLGKAARTAMRENAMARMGILLGEGARAATGRLCDATMTDFLHRLAGRCERELSELESPLRRLEEQVDELRALRTRSLELERACSVSAFALEEISLRFGRSGQELVLPARPRREALPAGEPLAALPPGAELERLESEPEGAPALE